MKWVVGLMTALLVIAVIAFFIGRQTIGAKDVQAESTPILFDAYAANHDVHAIEPPRANHVATPESVKAVYMSSYVAGTARVRERLVQLIKDTEVNAIVIDIKDASGKIAFPIDHPLINEMGTTSRRISDIEEFLQELHEENIYVIGRVQAFQDPLLAAKLPGEAVQSISAKDIWRDRKGLSWMDPSSILTWEYLSAIAHESYDIGFDEINFDYVRFPSDGNLSDIAYPISGSTPRREVMKKFFQFLGEEFSETDIVISADIFGLTTTAVGSDLGIGQYLEDIAPYVDYVAPMVYPSHYASGSFGFANPAEHPYDIIHRAMTSAAKRLEAIGENPDKLRPWLQDFDLGAVYTADMVRAQMNATDDSGLDSWMLWDPSNLYTRGALKDSESAVVH